MWRFLNSIPRALRQQLHGPRASVGLHVDEGEHDQESNGQSCHDVSTNRRVESNDKIVDDDINCELNAADDAEPKFSKDLRRKSSLIKRVLLGWNLKYEGYEGFFGRSNSQGERTNKEKEEHWWKACRHDFLTLLNRNHLLEILSVGACYGWGPDWNKDAAKKKLLFRVLFSLSSGDNSSLNISGSKSSFQESPPLSCDSGCCQSTVSEVEDTQVLDDVAYEHKADSNPESIECALKEFENLCNEYSSKNESLLGLECAEKGNMASAFSHLKRACAIGNVSACFNVGLCYETGTGVVKDLHQAVNFYEKAASQGHRMAMYNLGLIYLNNHFDPGGGCKTGQREDNLEQLEVKGRQFIKEAAKLGLSQAQTQMGIFCMEQEKAKDASQYFQSAAKQNDCEAQYFLAMCYEQGLGVECDLERSACLYSQAASDGHEGAMYNLAVFHELGWGGLPVDINAACDLYQKAADKGHSMAKSRLQDIAAKREEEKRLAEKKTKEQHIQRSSTNKKYFRSVSPISPSASSPDLLHLSDITSIFFPESSSPSRSSNDSSFISIQMKKPSFVGDNGVFYIGGNSSDLSHPDHKSQPPFRLKLKTDHLSTDELSFPMYGHLPKSHTSPSLSTMVACNL